MVLKTKNNAIPFIFQAELESQKKSTDIANFKSEFAIVYERKQAERKRDKYKRLLSFENLALYPDYQRRLLVLRELNYIDEHDSVILKGMVWSRNGGQVSCTRH